MGMDTPWPGVDKGSRIGGVKNTPVSLTALQLSGRFLVLREILVLFFSFCGFFLLFGLLPYIRIYGACQEHILRFRFRIFGGLGFMIASALPIYSGMSRDEVLQKKCQIFFQKTADLAAFRGGFRLSRNASLRV
jgi:hypothetical protein